MRGRGARQTVHRRRCGVLQLQRWARQRLAKWRAATIIRRTVLRHVMARRQYRLELTAKVFVSVQLAAVHCGRAARVRLAADHAAATSVQQWWRFASARATLRRAVPALRKRQLRVRTQQRRQEAAQVLQCSVRRWLHISRTQTRLHAATVLQRTVRHWLRARHNTTRRFEAARLLRRTVRSWLQQRRTQRRQQAVQTVQRTARRWLQRRHRHRARTEEASLPAAAVLAGDFATVAKAAVQSLETENVFLFEALESHVADVVATQRSTTASEAQIADLQKRLADAVAAAEDAQRQLLAERDAREAAASEAAALLQAMQQLRDEERAAKEAAVMQTDELQSGLARARQQLRDTDTAAQAEVVAFHAAAADAAAELEALRAERSALQRALDTSVAATDAERAARVTVEAQLEALRTTAGEGAPGADVDGERAARQAVEQQLEEQRAISDGLVKLLHEAGAVMVETETLAQQALASPATADTALQGQVTELQEQLQQSQAQLAQAEAAQSEHQRYLKLYSERATSKAEAMEKDLADAEEDLERAVILTARAVEAHCDKCTAGTDDLRALVAQLAAQRDDA